MGKTDNTVRKISLAHLIITIVYLGIILFSPTIEIFQNNSLTLWKFLSIFIFVWILWSWRAIKGSIFNPYGIFLIAVFLFNLSLVPLSLIPGNSKAILTDLFPREVVTSALIIVSLSLAGLQLGALLATTTIQKFKPKIFKVNDQDITLVAYILILISIYPLFLTSRDSIALSINLGYNSLYQQTIGTGLLSGPSILANLIIPGILLLVVSSKKNRANRLLSIILITILTVVNLILGKRSAAIMPLIAYLWLWHKTIKPIKFELITTGSLIFLFFVFPFIRFSRNTAGFAKFSWQGVAEMFTTTNPMLDVFNEMGSTLNTICHTVQIIPLYRSFDLGISYFYSITTILPNLFWKTHPAIEHGTFSAWLINLINPEVARLGGSIGYSFIAEAYANFSSYGTLIIVAIIGFLFVLFSEYAEKNDNKVFTAALATYLSFFLFFARSESSAIIRPFFWYSLLPVFLTFLVSKFRTKDV